ncbi:MULTISPECIES: aminopeptidase [unclassified Fusibacter]|uniref:aminopeptidase n=1 Tax=unclassified Fusibacter TaxID=2624464 RepID=UPI0010118A75|nr:aminopeptidase [Fusibacter sp. A1]MCK8058625.1 aminopeptidase [Fusibacter sp. A2]NPE21700.1 aminopeptidase [Fusibacter sp. A1]RXV61275.1 aminopeptidase [Fusibacter sp. A1]
MKNIEKYADLLVQVGINIQKGQTLVISAPIETADFARLAAKKAYEAGAKEVVMRWLDEQSARMRFDMASDEVFDEVADWIKPFFDGYAEMGAAFLTISASDPEMMKGVDPKRMSRQQKSSSQALLNYRTRMMSNKNVWCVASIPTEGWAVKVFPGVPKEQAIDLLWDAIYKAVRVDQDEPIKAWREHQANLNEKLEFLNGHQFEKLIYKNSIGTNVEVKLPKDHLWFGGGDESVDSYLFVANMPTEEVFTMPDKDGVNGRIVSSIPLNYHGNLIEEFWFEFKDGLVVEYGAAKGEDVLAELLATDEGARRLGEVALVPYDSPISNQKILFYNTLYDENASCHFAVGKAYPTCIKGGEDMSKEELLSRGANDSITHVDFMIGTPDLEIVGIKSTGESVPVFINGNFC